jgi:hypothetical protein
VEKLIRLTLTLISLRQIEGEYGLKTIMNYRTADGSKVTWFASGDPGDGMTEIGKEYDVMASVKKHDQYQGIAQTVLTRVAPYVEKAKKGKKSAQEIAA